MLAVEPIAELGLLQPYPGLRPFETDEALKFYGRETHTADLLRRLAENRFLAVVGNSGSGKSSLVRAGLLPALHRGRLIGATSQWRICVMRPGDEPMKSLAASLASQKVFSSAEDAVLQELTRSSLGLVRTVRASEFAPGESLLLVVDQFEELFRFVRARKDHDGGAEARLFVSSLLEAADLSSAPVYVVLTMRSDFLGECSQFRGLPEALNRSQFLIPRMTREQIRDGIVKPLRLVAARMSGKLVERLLNELGDDTGQLPVLQHALNRTFTEFQNAWETGKAGAEIGLDDYISAGEIRGALDAHANSLLQELRSEDPEAEVLVERIFRCLTTVEAGRKVRRPTRLDLLYAIVGADLPDEAGEAAKQRVRKVIATYADPAHAMLVQSGRGLTGDSVIDISHESLIEHWTRLKDWMAAEAGATALYLSAAEDTVRNRLDRASRWRRLKLAEALGYLEAGTWNASWAGRLGFQGATFDEVKAFLDREVSAQRAEEEEKDSRQTWERAAERRNQRWVIVLGLAAIGLGVMAALSVLALLKLQNSEAVLRQQVMASDNQLNQNFSQQQNLRSQIDQTSDPAEKSRLQLKLSILAGQETQLWWQRDLAQGRLSAEWKDKMRVNPTDGLTYVFIPSGYFIMGCSPGDPDCEADEKPHAEQIAAGFWLGRTEVTQGAWKKVNIGPNLSDFKSDQLPVENVDWNQAAAYCAAVGGRLPTEKEWEYAARAGTTTAQYGQLDAVAWYSLNSGGSTHPAALKQPNAYGLYDMLGNVWECTADSYDPTRKALRGGSWPAASRYIRASSRAGIGPSDRVNNVGFRCAIP